MPTAQAIASRSMTGRSLYRFFSLNCLLSFKSSFLKSSGRITAAANTAPAKQPLPASSHPASIRPVSIYGNNISQFIIYRIYSFVETEHAPSLQGCTLFLLIHNPRAKHEPSECRSGDHPASIRQEIKPIPTPVRRTIFLQYLNNPTHNDRA